MYRSTVWSRTRFLHCKCTGFARDRQLERRTLTDTIWSLNPNRKLIANFESRGRRLKPALFSASTSMGSSKTVRLLKQSERYFSENCDGRKDVDIKSSPIPSTGEVVDDPNKCRTLETSEQGHNSSLLGTDQELDSEKQVSTSEQSQLDTAELKPSEDDKKRGDRKLNSLKIKFKRKLAKRLISWEKISDTFANFPYYLNEHTRNLLIESAAAQLRHHNHTKFGKLLRTSSHLILLSGPPGTEIYQEKLVRALSQNLQTSLLILDSDVLASQHIKEENPFLDSESGEDKDFSRANARRIWPLSSVDVDESNDDDDDEPRNKHHRPEAKRFVQQFEQFVRFPDSASGNKGTLYKSKEAEEDEDDDSDQSSKHNTLKIGDYVRFIGSKDEKSTKRRSIPRFGQQGQINCISQAWPEKIGVFFELGGKRGGGSSKRKTSGLIICDAKDLEKVDINCHEKEPWMTPIEAFSELAAGSSGMIIFFPDIQKWMTRAVPIDERSLFLHTLGEVLNKSTGPAVFIAGRTKETSGTNNNTQWNPMKLFSSVRSSAFRRFRFQLRSEKEDTKGTEEVYDHFKNIIPVLPPQEPEDLRQWKEQLDQDKKKTLVLVNTREIQKVLSENAMKCLEVSDIDTSDLHLTEKQAQKVVGWARNISLSEGLMQQKGRHLYLPQKSLERAIARFRAIENSSHEKVNDVKVLAENEYESELASSVIRAKEIGVTFDQIGALEDVKSTLKELIILPLRRPELFRKGNLRKPCKGVLLFGPPGTGKTLLAKAVATEAGANFMSINTSNITSKWFGDAEKLARSLFTLAKKLEPAIIFIDEVDGILRARGDASEHEASRRVRNELMAAWDGLQSKESERILVLATTNRPFDLDDAVIRRLPRRIFVDLPDVKNREKILQVLLSDEGLGGQFNFQELAVQTEGFSGSDLKNLCVAAAYRPIREYLEAEKQGNTCGCDTNIKRQDIQVSLRPLCLNDFVQAKAKVGMSITYDASSMVQMRQWNDQYGEGGSRTKSVFGFIN